MRFSVVVCTVDRARGLERLLGALRHQTHRDFEVVVVAGPSTDDTDHVLAAHADAVRVIHNEHVHLSRSRNLGIEAAAGDVVAFIDDDAIPEPGWLAGLAAGFDAPDVVGVGGFVREADGTRYQYRYSVCPRTGRARHQDEPPGPEHVRPGADPFVYLQGTNASFRREALRGVDGFDEEIEFFHDETDLCARLLDAGGRLRVVEGAEVIHKYEASRVRDAEGRIRDPFAIVKNHVYFAYRHAPDRAGTPALEAELQQFADIWRAQAQDLSGRGVITAAERDETLRRVDEGYAAGIAAAARPERRTRPIGPPEAALKPFPLPQPAAPRRVVFVSSEYPPGDFGGIGRFTQDLAIGLAARGCETHVVVPHADPPPLPGPVPSAPHPTVIDFESGVWVHRVPPRTRAPRLGGISSHEALERGASAFHAVVEVEGRYGPVDVVSAPVWSGDGLVLSLDPSRPVVTTLMTTLRTVVALQPSWQGPEVELLLALEAETLRRSRHFHAISQAILDGVRADYPVATHATEAQVLHLGVRDRREQVQRTRPAGRTRILFVGRLERRKGVDLLLDAAVALLRRRPDVELVLVGKDTPNTELGTTYREHFTAQHPDLLDRVTFAGAVSEEDLYQHYADADLFAGPSRYESFGLVHVEAMMMGLPVIGCRVGGLREVVSDGETGLLTEADAEQLEVALERLVADGELRSRMGRAARARYERIFADETVAERTAGGYAAVAAAHHGRSASRDELEHELAASVERTTNLPAHHAYDAARALLSAGSSSPLETVARAWNAGPEALVNTLYTQLLARTPAAEEHAQMLARLEGGAHRGELVRDVGWSAEAAGRGLDTTWLGSLLELDGWTEERAAEAAFRQPADERFAQDVTDLLVAAPAARAATRERILTALAGGSTRLDAAMALLASGGPLRHAPDFAGWGPMLGHFAAQSPQSARLPSPSSNAEVQEPPVIDKARSRAGRLREAVQGIRETRDRSAAIADAVGRIEGQLREQQARSEEQQRQTLAAHDATGRASYDIYQLAGEIQRLVQLVEDHAAIRAEDIDNRHKDIVNALHVTGYRVDILQSKLAAMAIDLRDRLPAQPLTEDLPAPVIRNEQAVRQSPLKINLGAGEKPVDGYVNVDMRPLDGVDVVADVRRLPFEPGTLDELSSAHLVEHFRANVLEVVLLPYWRSLLASDGTLRIVCPNWEAMTRRLAAGDMTWDEFKVLTFGLQDYDGDDHFAMYTPATLTELLERTGFGDVKLVAEDRMNGMCPEMELTARPAGAAGGAGEQAAAGLGAT